MTTNRNKNDQEKVVSLRERLEAAGKGSSASRKLKTDEMLGKVALARLPHHYRRVMSVLHEAGVLLNARIDYVDREMRCIDFAWPQKLIGLRVIPWPLRGGNQKVPDFVFNDAAMREQNWLILSVDPYSPNFEEQVDRVVSVVKRVGAPRKASR